MPARRRQRGCSPPRRRRRQHRRAAWQPSPIATDSAGAGRGRPTQTRFRKPCPLLPAGVPAPLGPRRRQRRRQACPLPRLREPLRAPQPVQGLSSPRRAPLFGKGSPTKQLSNSALPPASAEPQLSQWRRLARRAPPSRPGPAGAALAPSRAPAPRGPACEPQRPRPRPAGISAPTPRPRPTPPAAPRATPRPRGACRSSTRRLVAQPGAGPTRRAVPGTPPPRASATPSGVPTLPGRGAGVAATCRCSFTELPPAAAEAAAAAAEG